tara:strand:+ start:62 stop:220 length:159 start_codon:yes stop_codon:yes gene_type:complete
MKAINISEEQIERAKKLYSFGELKGSKTKGNGVWTFKDDCYNLQIGKLNKFN